MNYTTRFLPLLATELVQRRRLRVGAEEDRRPLIERIDALDVEGVVLLLLAFGAGASADRLGLLGPGAPGRTSISTGDADLDLVGEAWRLLHTEYVGAPELDSRALAYAHGIGGTRGGVLETTFREETETDLFGEQAVLCGGATELIVRGFETLCDAGYQPEVAYFECMHEMKLIVDLLHEGGLKKMHQYVSDTAKWGDLKSGPRIIDQHVRDSMKQVLKEIQDGTFAREWIEENKTGQQNYKRLMQEDLDQRIEKVGKALRGRMSWLQE